jgi:hypothetical protein
MRGIDLPQPLLHKPKEYTKLLRKLGYKTLASGKIVKGAAPAAKKAKAGIGGAK